jgi:hypothetical protein
MLRSLPKIAGTLKKVHLGQQEWNTISNAGRWDSGHSESKKKGLLK